MIRVPYVNYVAILYVTGSYMSQWKPYVNDMLVKKF